MRTVYLLALAVVSVSSTTYMTTFDDLDIKALVASDERLKFFVDCFNHKVECDEVTSTFKSRLQEAIEEKCKKCTDAQKRILRGFLVGLKEKFPAEYELFKTTYDSDSKHLSDLEEVIAQFQ